MKANEFMIGDWVTGKKWRENPLKLIRINDNGKYYYGITSDGTQVGPFLLEEIEPIPITPDILEKNGFEERHDYFPYVYFLLKESGDSDNYSASLETEYDTERSEEYWSCNAGNYNADVTIAIHYVHEMQHIFRLCGINKEIVIK